MPAITLLSEDLINKIAAGEVIERPASVVKELLENSLDAGARRITIELAEHGKSLIKVIDNGSGMTQEDARNCILRHATSKIKDEEDLFAIATLGFRGEALASIAAVSRLSITTKPHGQAEGYTLVVEGGRVIHSTIAGAEAGTQVEVRNLFFNTPARKKFLKTDAVELRHTIDTVTRYALINHSVAFRLVHDGHELLNAPAVENLRSKVSFIHGASLAKEMLEVAHGEAGIRVSGLIAPPHHAKNDKSQQSIFVNRRWVRSPEMSNAVYDGYHSLLFVSTHPVIILNIGLDPSQVDVNIHPTKAEVKFARREAVQQVVRHAVEQTLRQHNLIPELEVESRQLSLGQEEQDGRETSPQYPTAKYGFEPGSQTVFKVRETAAAGWSSTEDVGEEVSVGEEVYAEKEGNELMAPAMPEAEEIDSMASPLVLSRFPSLRLLGQVHKTFFIAETIGGLFYIDQHAAHERVLYERFMQQYMQEEVQVQQLLQGEIMELSPAENGLVEEHRALLEQMGFTLEPFGGNSVLLKSVPLLLGRLQPKEVFYDVLGLLREGKHQLLQAKEEIVTRMACRAAVMAGEEITLGEMEKYLQELSKTKQPFTCPHGRPTLIKVDVGELEKKFKRR